MSKGFLIELARREKLIKFAVNLVKGLLRFARNNFLTIIKMRILKLPF